MPTMSARDFLAQKTTKPLVKPKKESTMFPIVDDLPIPQSMRGSKYPFDELDVNQAFIIPVELVPAKGISCVRAAISAYYKRTKSGVKLTEIGRAHV